MEGARATQRFALLPRSSLFAAAAAAAAANAAAYVPKERITVSGNSAASATVTINFDRAFKLRAQVTFGVTGAGRPATLSSFKAESTATFVKAADANGGIALNVALPSDASGSYAVTGTDGTTIGTATLTVAAVDAGTGTGLAHTGYEAPLLLIWGAAGALMLGIALVVVLSIVRRQRANA